MKRYTRWLYVIALTQLLMGCANVRPYEKENLADPIMTISSDEALRELKWLEAREGSTGGAGGAGGGCGCK
ncbi:MAG TPA: DUF4266 domain-containing protein [Candidatus Krumholzibacteria bacterium]|nr:DUF4266 domain-containing protein [Candidatus Krumholzibacteria bacterium]